MKISASLHDLKACDLNFAHVNVEGKVATIDSTTGVQLHWDSLDDFDAWIDRLYGLVYPRKSA